MKKVLPVAHPAVLCQVFHCMCVTEVTGREWHLYLTPIASGVSDGVGLIGTFGILSTGSGHCPKMAAMGGWIQLQNLGKFHRMLGCSKPSVVLLG